MQRDEDGVGGDQGVQGKQAEARRAVDQDVVVSGGGVTGAQRVAEAELAAGLSDEFDFGAGEVGFGWDDGEVRDRCGADCFCRRAFLRQQGIGAVGAVVAAESEAGGGVALRVEIDEQDGLAGGAEGGGEVDAGCGFADSAFLVGNGQDAPGARRSGDDSGASGGDAGWNGCGAQRLTGNDGQG